MIFSSEIPESCKQNVDLTTDGNCTNNSENGTCAHFSPLSASLVDACVAAGTYDYFASSETPYILTFAGLGTVIAG